MAHVVLSALQIVLAFGMGLLGTSTFFRHSWAESLLRLRGDRALIRVWLPVALLFAAIASAAGIAVPLLAFFSAVVDTALALLLFLFLRVGSASRVLLPFSIIFLSLIVALLQPLGLKVMLLPKADPLPYEPVVANIVKTYGEGVWFESVRAGNDGTLYLAANRGLDFSQPDYYRHAHGEVIEREPNGQERVLFRTPAGSAAGVTAIAHDGTIFMSSNGVTSGIWRLARDGRGAMITKLPHGAWPNGLDFGPDGSLYAPDSSLGLVWRIDPENGRAVPALKDELLRPRRFVSLAPGANGIHFRGRTMIVTVSDSAMVLAYVMREDGSFEPVEILARGIPGDDFAVGPDGSLFITTHPYNTLVRIYPNGRRVIIGNSQQHIIGATDAVFGTGATDKNVLYVATDGGAFTGGPKSRGELIALTP